MSVRGRWWLSVVGCAALLAATACGGGDGEGSGGAGEEESEARRGGTLRIVGESDVDHLDTASAYYTPSYMLERAFTRQLLTYPADRDRNRADDIVADVAADVPSTANGGISADGKTYTFTLRDGVRWDTQPPRDVTAQDFVRGLERLCNPKTPVGAPGYFTTTIAGFDAYCEGLTKVAATPAAIRGYLEAHDISGLKASDDKTLEITLLQPTSDFLNIMALPFASAAPEEYLQYLPDSPEFRQNTISNGPYSIETYEADQRIELARNPAWDQAADPVREAWVDRIEVEFGNTAESVQQQLETGDADMSWDTPVPTARIPMLRDDERLGIQESGSTAPYIVINMQGNNNGGALKKLLVRQALNYAVDKVAVGQVYGGPDLNTPLHQVLPPTIDGHEPFNLYPSDGDKGDPKTARQLLTRAGYPNGLTLKMLHRTEGNQPKAAQTIQASFAMAGIKVQLTPLDTAAFYGEYLDVPAAAKRGAWDIATPSWLPDWTGNAARTLFVPLFYGKDYGPGSTNSGGYVDAQTDACIDRALRAADAAEAAPIWHDCDRMVMGDAPFVPLQNQKQVTFHSDRVENFIYYPLTSAGDITHVWLADA
jgi:peptide/nickel transport system substrate-binding protein